VESICRGKWFTIGSRNSLGDVRKSQMMADQVRKWLRQQSKYSYFYAAGFDALLKQWDKCMNVGGGYVEKQMFHPCSNIACFTFYIHLWPIYWLSFVYICFLSCVYLILYRQRPWDGPIPYPRSPTNCVNDPQFQKWIAAVVNLTDGGRNISNEDI
jgi:hypothetical protein